MLNAGKAVKVSIYLSEGSGRHGISSYSRILDFLFFRGVSGATVLKGVAGFGADHHLHSAERAESNDKPCAACAFSFNPLHDQNFVSLR